MNTKVFAEYFVLLLPFVMTAVFFAGAFFRYLIYYTVRRHEWFAREFEKRVNHFVEKEVPGESKDVSFYVLSKRLLERTYYEVFEVRDRMKRRNRDQLMATSDRLFLIRQGCAWLVKDILKQLKFLKWTEDNPKLLNITKATFNHNPCFNRVFGIIPISSFNDVLSILPGLFVVAGILGTFIGIAGGLQELGGMNMNDLENAKNIMDRFLHEIAFAMKSSIAGITFSLILHVFNTIFSPDRSYVSMIDRFESALDLLWYRSDNNHFPKGEPEFDEHKDAVEALAEKAVEAEIAKSSRGRELDSTRGTKVA